MSFTKIAGFYNHFRALGAQAAITNVSREKTAGISPAMLGEMIPRSRIGKLGLAAGLGTAGALGYNAMRPDPSLMDTIGDSLGSMSQEDLMGYANMLGALSHPQMQGGYSGAMGYSPIQGMQPEDEYGDYASDIGNFDTGEYADSDMGYSRAMSPEEQAQYLAYYGA